MGNRYLQEATEIILWEFTGLRETKYGLAPGPITRPPQSWRYVEEELWND